MPRKPRLPRGPKPSEMESAPSPGKAREILHDKQIRGKALTPAQRGLFGAIAGKKS